MPARILLVEDNATNLDLMTYILNAFGHTVTRARDGVAGLEALAGATFDLILADMLMPRMDGYGFVKQVRQDGLLTPVIAVTALAMVGDRERILQAGFNGYISKPINPETFSHEVDRFLPADLRSGGRRAQARPSQSSAPVPTAEPTGRTILVVDDVPSNAHVVRAAIEPFGHAVVEARSMDEALEAAAKRRPDLVLTDIHMPEGSGYDLIRAFKERPEMADIPFIFLSSTYWHELDKARGLSLGAKKFLLRPIDPQTLLDEVNDTLGPDTV